MSRKLSSRPERRSFITGLNAGVTSLAAMAIGGVALAQEKPPAGTRWEPARHDKDDWMDGLPGKHRLVFDTITDERLTDALLFANNFLIVNRSDYGLENKDLAVIVVVRHLSTSFGYNNEMWAKYGASMMGGPGSGGSQAKEPPKANVHAATMDSLSKQGVQFAVCSMATRANAGMIARTAGKSTDTIFAELTSNLVSNARMVPAGIVAVNRAQERGYSLVSA
jgi:intracellular sulfur oxidation DsrE/DsrF family protein